MKQSERVKPSPNIQQGDELMPDLIDNEQPTLSISTFKITPSLASAITGYSESTCTKVLYGLYPNRDISEFIIQQINIFSKRIEALLRSNEIYETINGILDGKKVRKASQIRLLVELQNISQILNR